MFQTINQIISSIHDVTAPQAAKPRLQIPDRREFWRQGGKLFKFIPLFRGFQPSKVVQDFATIHNLILHCTQSKLRKQALEQPQLVAGRLLKMKV